MSYPPGSPGYPPSQQPTTQFSAPTQQFGKVPDAAGDTSERPNNLPRLLLIAVTALGVLAFIFSLFDWVDADQAGPGGTGMAGSFLLFGVIAALLAALLAGFSLVPRQRAGYAVIAALATFGFLFVVAGIIQVSDGADLAWPVWLILVLTLLQAGTAIAALLFESGVLTPPAPKQKYDQQQQFGQYGQPGGYYGGPQQHPGQQQLPQQRPGGYPTQYGGGYPGQPQTGGFQAPGQQGGQQSGPPTPPTGFPTYGQPQQPSAQAPGQQQSPSSQQSGPAPS